MKKLTPKQLKIAGLVLLFGIIAVVIWLIVPNLMADEEGGWTATGVLMASLITVLAWLIGAGLLYIRHLKKIAQPNDQAATNHSKKNFKKHAFDIFIQLKTAFYSWGDKRSRYLRKLPWYIIFGMPVSGKTTLLLNSGLDFSPTETLGPDPLQNSDTQQNAIWRFSKEAVILDIAANSQDPFWAGVLKLIKRYRRRKPLNGALVSFNLPELLLHSEQALRSQQQALKSILQTVHNELGIQTPVYLVLSKCDLIAGFLEFFADLNREEREQVWGVTLPVQPFANKQQLYDYVNQELEQLIERLHTRVLWRLEAEPDPNKRALISYFPQQMQLCKQIISDFIAQDETMQLRGIYFTSNAQGGESHNFLLEALAVKYHLNAPAAPQYEPYEKSYFVQRLFHDVILPEADQVGHSPYLQKLKAMSYRLSWAAAVGALLGGSIGLSVSYARNKDNIEAIQRALPDYQQTVNQLQPNNPSLAATLPLLNSLKDIYAIYNNASAKWLLYFEIYQPLKIKSTLEDIWHRTLTTEFMPRVALRLENLLAQNQNNSELLYQTLKAYLVFSPATDTEVDWLRAPLADEQEPIKNYLEQALQYPVDTLLLNNTIITQTRERLRQVPPIEFAYYEMKQQQEQFSLAESVGPEFNNLFTYQNNNPQAIPSIYTLAGYKDLRGSKSKEIISRTAEIYQILGLSKKTHNDFLTSEMTPELWARYNIDYNNYWQRYLNNIRIARFTSLSQAIETLDNLISKHSPLQQTLYAIAENTQPLRGKTLTINQQFAALNKVTGLPGRPGNDYKLLMKNLTALRDYLNSVSLAPNSTQIEWQDASAYFQNKLPNHPITLLKKQAQLLPAPLNRWVDDIANHSLGLLLQGAHQIINSTWQSTVIPVYQNTVQGRFPFNKQAENFISLASFGEFFGNNGIMPQFMQTYLAPFIDSGHSPWRLYQVGGYTLGLAPNTVAQLEKSAAIRSRYFQNGDKTPAMQFFIRPRLLDSQSSSIQVQLANQTLNYRHGPQQSFSWHWPPSDDTQQASVTFNDFQERDFSQTMEGPWAWFKLLTSSHLQSGSTPGHYVWTISQDKHQASFDLWAANNMPVFNLEILQGFSLPTTL